MSLKTLWQNVNSGIENIHFSLEIFIKSILKWVIKSTYFIIWNYKDHFESSYKQKIPLYFLCIQRNQTYINE